MDAMMKCRLFFVYAVFFVFGASIHAQEEEVAKLETAINDAMKIIYSAKYEDETFTQKSAAVRAVLEQNYDLMVIIRRTMGRNWKLLSTAEQVRVKELISQLVVKAFIDGLQGLERPTIEYGKLISINDKRFEVSSSVVFLENKAFNITYRFGRLKTGWQIYDILAEDVSVVASYRQQIDDHFRKGTGVELIEKLEKLLERENLNEKTVKL